MKINETIRSRRKQLGLTQEQVANRLGVTATAVYKWESASCYPDITLLPALARLLGVDLNTLLCFQEDLTDEEIAAFANEAVEKMQQEGFAAGVALNDGVCKAAKLVILGEKTAEVTLQEGRYHQIKRMFGCFGAKVVSLHRLAMGNLYLPADLPEGACRELTAEELNQLQMRES